MNRNRQNKTKQTKISSNITEIFTQETDLPQIVQDKKQEAFDKVYVDASVANISTQPTECAKPSRRDIICSVLLQATWEMNRNYRNCSASPYTLEKPSRRAASGRLLPRAATIVLACLFVAGSTAIAATGFLSRRERLDAMDEEEIAEIYDAIQMSGALAHQSSRPWTAGEQKRYNELKTAYEKDERFPDSALPILQETDSYPGSGVCLQVTPSGTENILYLPETEMTDEEILEIIEYDNKGTYALYTHRVEQLLEKGNWESRLAAMTDKEIDFYYLAYQVPLPTSGGYRRGMSKEDEPCLSESEEARFQTLETAYEQENRFPEKEIAVIEQSEDYDGTGIAFCWHYAVFYLPERELEDEEILEIIDFQKKSLYALSRVEDEISTGCRTERPKRQNENAQTPDIPARPFADTEGSGSLQEIENAQIGDTVLFGSYEQDNDAANGNEEIEWYVLDRTPDSLTLLSVKILDARPYSPDQTYTSWADSELRGWLNSEFYKTAFTDAEQTRMREVATESGPDAAANDHVSLLSYEELLGYFGISADELVDPASFESTQEANLQNLKYYQTLDSRIFAVSTAAARAKGLWYWAPKNTEEYRMFNPELDFTPANGRSSWWLRSASAEKYPLARMVGAEGAVNLQESIYLSEGVRPVIKITR